MEAEVHDGFAEYDSLTPERKRALFAAYYRSTGNLHMALRMQGGDTIPECDGHKVRKWAGMSAGRR